MARRSPVSSSLRSSLSPVVPLALAVALALVPGCADGPTRDAARVHLVQEVLLVGATLSGACPPEVTVEVLAGHGACDRLRTPEVERDGATVTVRILAETDPGVCTAQLVGTSLTVPLGSGFAPGDYRVVVPAESRPGETGFAVAADCR